MINTTAYKELRSLCDQQHVTLVAVSKFKSIEDIQALYDLGQRDFGENFVQELAMKYDALPRDIRWHFIGHLQSNKVKYIAPFVHLIHGVDSERLLSEINKQGSKSGRRIECLLQVHIAEEETKFGLDETETSQLLSKMHSDNTSFQNVLVRGLMGMASFTDNHDKVSQEFTRLHRLFQKMKGSPDFNILSMGMSGDYATAIQTGSTMIRVGSLIFGNR